MFFCIYDVFFFIYENRKYTEMLKKNKADDYGMVLNMVNLYVPVVMSKKLVDSSAMLYLLYR